MCSYADADLTMAVRIGVIGGSGLYEMEGLEFLRSVIDSIAAII